MPAGSTTHLQTGHGLVEVHLAGCDGVNLSPGVTLFDATGVAISATNPLPTTASGGGGGTTYTVGSPCPTAAVISGSLVSTANPLPSSTVVSGSVVSNSNPLPASVVVGGSVVSNSNPAPTRFAQSTGTDYSVNTPTLPNVGAGFGSTGVYANYVLIRTVAAASRNFIDVENLSGAQIVIIRDDGTAAAAAAPVNASVIALAAGGGAGQQGGSWSSQTFNGRIQVYAPSSGAQVSIFVD